MTQVLEMVYTDPFFHGFCPVKNWKKTKKRYRDHLYEILDPVQVGSFMEFKYISQSDYMRLLRDIFVEGVQSA
jgi:hypothetical protein